MNCINAKQIFRMATLAILLTVAPSFVSAQGVLNDFFLEYEEEFETNGMKYKVWNWEPEQNAPLPIVVVGYTGDGGTLTFPERFRQQIRRNGHPESHVYSFCVTYVKSLGDKPIDKLVLSSTVEEIGRYVLDKVKVVEMPKASSRYRVENGALIDQKTGELLLCSKNVDGTFTIPSDVKKIEGMAFKGCTGLTAVVIPSSVKTIGMSCFSGCSSLASVTIPTSVTDINHYAFMGCKSLTSASVPANITEKIKTRAPFEQCSNLKAVTVRNADGTKKQSRDWWWFKSSDPNTPKPAPSKPTYDPDAMENAIAGWPAPTRESSWHYTDRGEYKTVTWGGPIVYIRTWEKSNLSDVYTLSPDGSKHKIGTYNDYDNALGAAYFYSQYNLIRKRGKKY